MRRESYENYNFSKFVEDMNFVFQKNGYDLQLDAYNDACVSGKYSDKTVGEFNMQIAYNEFQACPMENKENPQFNFECFVKEMKSVNYASICENNALVFKQCITEKQAEAMAAETEAEMTSHVFSEPEATKEIPAGFSCPFAKDMTALLLEIQGVRSAMDSLKESYDAATKENTELKTELIKLSAQIEKLVPQVKENGNAVIALGETGRSPIFAKAGQMIQSFREFAAQTKDSIFKPFKSIRNLFSKDKTFSDDEKLLNDIVVDAEENDKVEFEQNKLISFDFLKNACDGIKNALYTPVKDGVLNLYDKICEGIQNSRYQHALSDVQHLSKLEQNKQNALSRVTRCDLAVHTARTGFINAFNIARGKPEMQPIYKPSWLCEKISGCYKEDVDSLSEAKKIAMQNAERLMPKSVRAAKEKAQADLAFLNSIEPITKD